MKKIFNKTFAIIKNTIIFLFGFLLGRSKKSIIFGAWMGDKFADNSRFLFQYLSDNKNDLQLDNIVWATRSVDVYNTLKKMNYHTVLIGTKESFYWHCKSGIHIVCNTQIDGKIYRSDIDTSLSCGALKIQLWHGNGIKCVPGDTRTSHNFVIRFLKNISTPGLWYVGNYYFLCKCDLDFYFFEKKFMADRDHCIDSAYPRTQPCIRYYGEEQELITSLSQFNKIILFLPTFRNSYKNYIHPLQEDDLISYFEENNYLWIEKPHAADKESKTILNRNSTNILTLDSTFDINVLMPFIDILVTDYSSAMLDAMFFRKQIVYYVPDFEYYIKDDRGFIIDYDSVCINPKVMNIDELKDALQNAINKHTYDENAENIRSMFWKYDDWSYKEIWNSIIKHCNVE